MGKIERGRKRIVFLPASFILLLLNSCAVKNAIKETREQINFLEKSNKEIVAKIDSATKEEKDFLLSMQTITLTKFNELSNRIEVVENKIEDMYRLQKRPLDTQDADKSISRNIFPIAYSDFTKGNHELAIAGLQKYLSDLPRSSEAYFLLGESYYALEKWTEAEITFNNLLQNYPAYEKVPAILYKLCLVYEAKHDTLALQDCLAKLFKNYSETSEAKLAKERFTKPLQETTLQNTVLPQSDVQPETTLQDTVSHKTDTLKNIE